MAIDDGTFWWGTAASSTQTEGAAPRSDWSDWEKQGRAPASGEGNGFTTNYRDDFRMLADLGLTHHRLSLEWARLEPFEDKHDREAVDFYRDLLREARDAGLSIWVCLHHFTLPGWFSEDRRGFGDHEGRTYYWARHVDWMAETFGDLVFGWKPINEPMAFAAAGWLLGVNPPGRTNPREFFEMLEGTHLANHEAARLLRSGTQPVATVHNLSPLVPADNSGEALQALRVVDEVYWGSWIRMYTEGVLQVPGRSPIENEEFIDAFDYIGFSYYGARAVHGDFRQTPYPLGVPLNPLGDAIWPEGLLQCLERLGEELPGRDLLVAECGLGTTDDDQRQRYYEECLNHVADARADGIGVKGFFAWTAVDNYEWIHGYDVPFGIIDRDRTPKGSAEVLRRAAMQ